MKMNKIIKIKALIEIKKMTFHSLVSTLFYVDRTISPLDYATNKRKFINESASCSDAFKLKFISFSF